MSTQSENLSMSLTVALAGSNAFGNPTFNLNPSTLIASSLASGTGLNNADQFYSVNTTLAASGTATFVLGALGGALNPLGVAISNAKIKRLILIIQGNLNCTYLNTVAVHSGGGGSGYVVNDVLTIAGGTGTSATVKVTSVSSGAITGIQVSTVGSYTANPTLTSNAATGGTGSSASLDLTMLTVTSQTPPTWTDGDFLTIGNAGTNKWTAFIQSSGTILLYSGTQANPGALVVSQGGGGLAVAAGTSEQLKIVNSGSNPVTFSLILVGASA